MQRFVWDLLYPNPPSDRYDLPISAIYRDTPWVPHGPAVLPGVYNLKLTVDGTTYTQKLTVRMDPRVKTSAAGLNQQFQLSMQAYRNQQRANEMTDALARWNADPSKKAPLQQMEAKIKLLADGPVRKPGEAVPISEMPLGRLEGAFGQLVDLLQDADVAPSAQAVSAARELQTALDRAEVQWREVSKALGSK